MESIPATFLDVQAALASGLYDAWHFSGHGSYRNEPQPERSAMILQGGDQLTPEDLSGAWPTWESRTRSSSSMPARSDSRAWG